MEEEERSELKIARGFRELTEKRGITDMQAYFKYLHTQKMKKYNASEERMKEADREMKVLEKMLRGEL